MFMVGLLLGLIIGSIITIIIHSCVIIGKEADERLYRN